VRLVDCLDLGASLAPTSPCLVTETATLSYAETQGLSRSIASSLDACGVGNGDTVGVLSVNDPLALTCIFGASRAGAAWALIDPTEATIEELLQELTACGLLLFRSADAELVRRVSLLLPLPHTLVCLDGRAEGALGWGEFLVAGLTRAALAPVGVADVPDEAAGGDRPVFLALGPLTEATTSRWQPVLAQAGRIVMRTSDAPAVQRSRLEA
jgi:non-ribosomal peptide synthetase component F